MTSAFAQHDLPAMRQADDGDLAQQLSLRAVPRDRHRVRRRLEVLAAEDCAVNESCAEHVMAHAFIDR
ncbi:hypothetical protein LPJ38_24000 [Bradyrhizobium daqingense]|uniref:hypothetical protein n=1 Tax=Bradyrhizobium daqingense TaxID=993502 RepID=UPI00119FB45B|nr:hypothetical protein [Bradyrhizobium daqingense]UFS86723.1 hypothetical protein LPJ38_24000 [Bradyrhizobium daqingense]